MPLHWRFSRTCTMACDAAAARHLVNLESLNEAEPEPAFAPPREVVFVVRSPARFVRPYRLWHREAIRRVFRLASPSSTCEIRKSWRYSLNSYRLVSETSSLRN